MSARLVVVGCGQAKRERRTWAGNLYVGALFLQQMKWARSVVGTEDIRILSAKHGLLGFYDFLDPYDQRAPKAGTAASRALVEVVQHLFIPFRTFSGEDLVADGAGAVVGLLCWSVYGARVARAGVEKNRPL